MTDSERRIIALKDILYKVDHKAIARHISQELWEICGKYAHVQAETLGTVIAVYVSRGMVHGQFKATR